MTRCLEEAAGVEMWWAEAGKYNVLPLGDRTYEECKTGAHLSLLL